MNKINNNLELVKIVAETIQLAPDRRITFANYMESILYHPEFGYYASSADRISRKGDFLTSPYLAKDFGETIAFQLLEIWTILECPRRFNIVEIGAGQGLLAAQILEYLRQEYADFFRSIDYIIIETSPAMIAAQQQRLNNLPVRWCQWVEIEDRSIVGCFLSNELIDAFPIHQVIKIDNKLQEIYVTIDEEQSKLSEVIGDLSTDRLEQYWQINGINLLSDRYPDRYRTEVNLAALDWLKTGSEKLGRGYIISIDYGYTADRYYHPSRTEGTLQCYYQHAYHNDPYINIGTQDLTTHVDFTALQNQGKLLGLETVGFIEQAIFLMALGLGDRIAAISSEYSDFASIFTRHYNLHQLIDPMGLGKFGVLIQSKGFPDTEKYKTLMGLSIS